MKPNFTSEFCIPKLQSPILNAAIVTKFFANYNSWYMCGQFASRVHTSRLKLCMDESHARN